MKVFVHTPTIFKAKPLPANQLPSHEKIEVPAGASFIARNNSRYLEDGHYEMIIYSYLGSGEQNRRDFWYIPRVHADIFESIAKVKTEGLNLRRSPNPNDSNNILDKLPLGAFVEIFDGTYVNQNLGIWWCGRALCTADKQNWLNGQIGWMSYKHLEMTDMKIREIPGGRGSLWIS
ncbi:MULTISPECIES: hypothetical protein [unclassified Limnospira]|uniref:hypothetical protein n=1 Tax=unclassified Limnospira TaxID=2642885 RepID=UPI0028E168F5|nr:hypothetical protein [Limnospira sp. PMC 289.06]MDT9310407.1 hypothetical protein [Limnospira sp. Paracas R14]